MALYKNMSLKPSSRLNVKSFAGILLVSQGIVVQSKVDMKEKLIQPGIYPLAKNIGLEGLLTFSDPALSVRDGIEQRSLLHRKLRHGATEAMVATLYLQHFYPNFSRDAIVQIQTGFILHDIGMSFMGLRWWGNGYRKRPAINGQKFDHVKRGLEVITDFEEKNPWWGASPIVRDIVRLHHERKDGTGMNKVKDKDLSFVAQMAIIVDQLVSRCEPRPYNGKYPRQTLREAVDALKSESNLFDTEIVDKFEKVFDVYFADVNSSEFTQNGLGGLKWLAAGWNTPKVVPTKKA